VRLTWARDVAALDDADWIVLPGSKQVSGDLAWMRASGLDAAIQRHALRGGAVLGICGGLQMLGRSLHDPQGHDGMRYDALPGLGLLPLTTQFDADKQLLDTPMRFSATTGPWAQLAGVATSGYQIHCGRTEGTGAVLHDATGQSIGWQQGAVLGVYAHGLFEQPAVLRALFGATAPSLEHTFDRLADLVERHFDAALLRSWFGR
jgi:adenosylcobyric acid synthase